MTTLPTLRAARDAADTRWHEAAVTHAAAMARVRRADAGYYDEAMAALHAAESAERDAEGAYVSAAAEYREALLADLDATYQEEAS